MRGTVVVPEVLAASEDVTAEVQRLGVSGVMASRALGADVPTPPGQGTVSSCEPEVRPVAAESRAGTRPVAVELRAGMRRRQGCRARAVCKQVALAANVWEDLRVEVGAPTHQLLVRVGTEPLLVQLDPQGGVSPQQSVRAETDPQSHVLV